MYRYEDSPEIEVRLEEDDNRTFYAGTSGASCYGGVFVPGCLLDPGASVRLRIFAPGSTSPFTADGSVRWKRDYDVATADAPAGCGISWQSTSLEARVEIARYRERGERRHSRRV